MRSKIWPSRQRASVRNEVAIVALRRRGGRRRCEAVRNTPTSPLAFTPNGPEIRGPVVGGHVEGTAAVCRGGDGTPRADELRLLARQSVMR